VSKVQRKVAIFLILLGPEVAGQVLKRLPEYLVERLTAAISWLGSISAEEKQQVVHEVFQRTRQARDMASGGEESAKSMLEAGFGTHKASSLLSRVASYSDCRSFQNLKRVDPLTVANYLKNEHVQTVAVVLAHMDPRDSGPILGLLPPAMQGEVAYRMAVLDRPNQETLRIVEEIIGKHVQGEFSSAQRQFGGKKQVAEILNEIEREVWQEILDEMREIDDEVASEVKNLMFVFDDLVGLDDRYIQEILKEIDSKELTLALKGATPEIQDKIFRNMSKRATLGIKEDMEYMGPVRVLEVEEAQQRIVEVVRSLEEAGTIILGKGGTVAEMVT
jgi:flagellar motor switch protein FliG